MLEPRTRVESGSCKETKMGPSTFLAETTTRQLFQWKTKVGHPTGVCSFKLGPRDGSDMKVLQPRSRESTSNTLDGKFPCGHKSGFEQQEFHMPKEECLNCVIELEYAYNGTKLFQCADINLYQQFDIKPLRIRKDSKGHIIVEKDACNNMC